VQVGVPDYPRQKVVIEHVTVTIVKHPQVTATVGPSASFKLTTPPHPRVTATVGPSASPTLRPPSIRVEYEVKPAG